MNEIANETMPGDRGRIAALQAPASGFALSIAAGIAGLSCEEYERRASMYLPVVVEATILAHSPHLASFAKPASCALVRQNAPTIPPKPGGGRGGIAWRK